jgi:hypothetical protein
MPITMDENAQKQIEEYIEDKEKEAAQDSLL